MSIPFPERRTAPPPRLMDKVRVRDAFDATVRGVMNVGGEVLVDVARADDFSILTHLPEQDIQIIERHRKGS